MWQPKSPQFVVKLTKHCNLRCKYCYEYPFLSDKTKIELPQIEAMLTHIAPTLVAHGIRQTSFSWHGGEPLLLPPDYYQAIYALQKKILGGAGIEFSNVMQSNLTLLKAGHLQMLKDGLVSGLGVSLDLFGDERVNVAGKIMDDMTLNNMQRLLDADISFGTISVLSHKTAPFMANLFHFFDEMGVSWRVLPIDLTGFEGQHIGNVLTAEKVIEIYKMLFEAWLNSKNAISVEPINEYMNAAMNALMPNSAKHKFDKAQDDSLFIVNTNGDLYAEADAYDDKYAYGNLFTTDLDSLLESPARKRAIERANMIVGSTCAQCPHHGDCSGFRMAEATTEKLYWDKDGQITCTIIRPMIDYIKERLVEVGLMPLLEKTEGGVV
jgi:uncharacterized protein